MPKLKKAVIEAAEPGDKLYAIMDDEVRGIGVRVHPRSSRHPNGRRAFFVRTYPQGSNKECRTHLGEYGLVTLDAARTEALRLIALADQGQFPSEVRKRARGLSALAMSRTFVSRLLR